MDCILSLLFVSYIPLCLSVGIYQQCGGEGYRGSTTCDWPLKCFRRSHWFSSCQTSCPGGDWQCVTETSSSTGFGLAKAWDQCGGEGWKGPRNCAQYPCQWRSKWYAQCRPDCPARWMCQTGASSTVPSTTQTTTESNLVTHQLPSQSSSEETGSSLEIIDGLDTATPDLIWETSSEYGDLLAEITDDMASNFSIGESEVSFGRHIAAQMLGSAVYDHDIHPLELIESRDPYDIVVEHIINLAEEQEPGIMARFGAALLVESVEERIEAWENMRERLDAISESPELISVLLQDPLLINYLPSDNLSEDLRSRSVNTRTSNNVCYPEIPNIGKVNGLYGDGKPTVPDADDILIGVSLVVTRWEAVKDLIIKRAAVLERVETGKVRVDPESRLGAYYATRDNKYCTVGHSVHTLIGALYLVLGEAGEEKIGRVFNHPLVKQLYSDSITSSSNKCMGDVEERYWQNVKKEDKHSFGGRVGSWFTPDDREKIQSRVGLRFLRTGYILDKYLGDYIENLDTNKLKFDLWKGDVVLEDLYLKPDILTEFNLPVTIKKGYLQKLSLHISWKHFYAHPIRINIDGLYVLAELKTDVKYNAEQEEKKQYKAKMKEVHKVEEFRKAQEEFERAKRLPKDQNTYLERLRLHLMRHLEISISNIHLAFEDAKTKVEHPFTFGITLNYIKFHTTNEEWEQISSSSDDSAIVYKFGELNALSIYWNSNIKSKLSEENLIDELHAKIMRNDGEVIENMSYVLQPLNIETKLQIASIPSEQAYVQPVLDVQIDFGKSYFNINRNQYIDLLDLFEHWDYITLQSKYIKYYETVESNNPKIKRWKFAYAAILNEVVRPRLSYHQWENMRENLNRCREYNALYLKKKTYQATKQEKERMHELEKLLDALNLVFIRRNIDLEIKKKKVEQKHKSTWEWLSTWWNNASNNGNFGLDQEDVITVDEEVNLYSSIHDKDTSQSPTCSEEYVDMKLAIRLDLLQINIWSILNENDSQFARITQIDVLNTNVQYQRRPATSAFLTIVDIDLLEVYGVQTDDPTPKLLQLPNKSQKVVHIEFETDIAKTNIDYRVHAKSPTIGIVYDAMTMNSLVDCFYPGVYRDLKGVKKKIYSMYMDIRHRMRFLFDYNIRNIKNLDIDIDLQSIYFILPENGVYRSADCSLACFDFGHLKMQGGREETTDHIDEETFEDAQSHLDILDSSYVPIKVQLEDIRFFYSQSNEDWGNLQCDRNSPIYLIQPYTINVDINKCIYVNDPVLPLWKINVNVSSINSRLSDERIFGIMKLIRSIPLPQLENTPREKYTIEELFVIEDTQPEKNTKKLFQTVENMARLKKKLQNDDLDAQPTEVDGTLNIPYIDILFQESTSDQIQPFVRFSFISLTAQTTVKTFHIDLQASLADFLVTHEQFLTSTNEPLRLLSTADKNHLLNMKCLLTSPENPSFYSAPYNRIENKVHVQLSKPLATLQIEALASIVRFQNHLLYKISKLPLQKNMPSNDEATTDNGKYYKKRPTSKFEIRLDQFRIIIGTEFSQLLDIHFCGFSLDITQTIKKFAMKLVLTDLHIHDLHAQTQYRNTMVQESPDIQVLYLDFIAYNHPKIFKRKLHDVDYNIKLYLNKMRLVLLYKYIDIILNAWGAFQPKRANVSPTVPNTFEDMIDKCQRQNLRICFDVILNAPTIFLPVDTHSREGIFIDLGELTLQTKS
ncbi:unnamed protein product [Adineta ricciae]|uniref:CBM1 domain-containing protein n=1 Tax=Adineta ricciae TaxID=249248 RepID=A0A815QGR5_ADIRI|nr:unnamed protein product [Adineta ricciae]